MIDIEGLIEELPDQERSITKQLRQRLLSSAPNITEKLAFGAPFYYHHKRFAFIWPASIPWGNLKEGVALGFQNGHLFENSDGLLQAEGRKQVYRIIYKSLDEIHWDQVHYWIQEALLIDENLQSMRKK